MSWIGFLADIRVFAISSLNETISRLLGLLSALEIPEKKFIVGSLCKHLVSATVGRSDVRWCWFSNRFLLFVEHESMGDPVQFLDKIF